MSFYCGCVLLLSIGSVLAWHSEENWATINDGRPSGRFDPVIFRKHPQEKGQLIHDAYAALYIDAQHRLSFGQAELRSDDQICATFNIDNSAFHTCSRFRVLQNSPRSKPFILIKPEKYDPKDYESVEYRDDRLVLVWDPDTQSSYFGTLNHPEGLEPIIFAVDYNGAPVEIKGRQATSGDYSLYVVEQKFNED